MISRKMARMVPASSGPLFVLQDVLEHFLFPGRRKDFVAVIVLDLADLRRQAGSLVDQLEDLQIELVDLGAQVLRGEAAVALVGRRCCRPRFCAS